MVVAGEEHLASGFQDARGDLVAVSRDNDPVGDAEGADALENADDDGNASEEPEGLTGEPRGVEPRGDDGERPHVRLAGTRWGWSARRCGARARRAADATFTPAKIGSATGFRNPNRGASKQ
jgi:hypothetical protein